MLVFIIAIVFYTALAGLSKSVSDVISFRYERSIFANLSEKWQQWTNPVLSWKNKKHKVFFIEWLLSGVLVPFTDLWHMTQALYAFGLLMAGWFAHALSLHLGFNLPTEFLLFIGIYFSKGIFFEYGFQKLFLKKDNSSTHKTRTLDGEDNGILNKAAIWYRLGNWGFKSFASVSLVFVVLVGQLLLLRAIHGGYDTLHSIPDVLQWPEWVILVEVSIFILSMGVMVFIPNRIKSKQ